MLFIFIWTCTRPRRLGSNVEILYAMLHDQSSLEAVFNHPAVASAGWAADLPMLLSHFQELTRKAEVQIDGYVCLGCDRKRVVFCSVPGLLCKKNSPAGSCFRP